MMKSHLVLTIMILVCAALLFGSAAYVQYMVTIRNEANVSAIGVELFSDPDATQKLTLLDWGTMEVGTSKTTTIYAKNVETLDVTLSFSVSNWAPENMSTFAGLSWSYSNEVIVPTQVLPINFTLAISQYVTGVRNFSFDITITATSTP